MVTSLQHRRRLAGGLLIGLVVLSGCKPDVGAAHGGSKADYQTASATLQSLPTTQRFTSKDKSGYERSCRSGDACVFGDPWDDSVDGVEYGHNGCDTRNDILSRDLTDKKMSGKCKVTSGTLHDQYTGHTISWSRRKPTAVQIDHIVPLYYAWQAGARSMPLDTRRRIANDPLNLIAVDGATNQGKGASGPAEWQPPNAEYRCAYALSWVRVVSAYRLKILEADRKDLAATLDACADKASG